MRCEYDLKLFVILRVRRLHAMCYTQYEDRILFLLVAAPINIKIIQCCSIHIILIRIFVFIGWKEARIRLTEVHSSR